MRVHRPGRPEDLPEPARLWARWSAAAVLTARSADEARGRWRTGWWAQGDALRHDDGGTSWWVLRRLAAGRFLLYGCDESGEVLGYEPRPDLFAGAPAGISPRVADEVTAPLELGCAYWWDGGRWGRAPYPDDLADDGLDIGLNSVLDPARVLSALDWEAPGPAAVAGELIRRAVEHPLTAPLVEEAAARAVAAGAPAPDLPAMLRALAATGADGTRPSP